MFMPCSVAVAHPAEGVAGANRLTLHKCTGCNDVLLSADRRVNDSCREGAAWNLGKKTKNFSDGSLYFSQENKIVKMSWAMVAHGFNPSTGREAETGGSL